MKIGRLDWFVYRLFFWRWNRILLERPDMAKRFGMHILKFAIREENK